MKIAAMIAALLAVSCSASNFIEFADKDGNNMIDGDEMIAYHREIEEKNNVPEAERLSDETLRSEVTRHDKNGNGFIDNEDFDLIHKEIEERKGKESN
jgi:Ca2+-binding EF-hand superfamily protein